jgi:enoyl-CoA hydratase/carnithine racemase
MEHVTVSEPLGIDFEEQDRAGIVTLNRPSRLNALSREMFEALSEQYRRWAPNPHIYGVLMQSTHPTVFCSGGDLKTVHDWNEQGALDAIRAFYRSAYTHVWVLEKFIRPNVPLINGLVFGGGIGITLYGTHCVAGEGYKLAMPQVTIGFLPDIGGTYFLSRLEAHTGVYLALTGRSIGPADAYRLGLITHYIPSAHFHVIRDALSDNHPIDRLLDGLHRDPGEGELARRTPVIERIFTAPTVEEILERLDAERGEEEDWAKSVAAEMRKKSPTSLKIALAQMQRGKSLGLADALRLEYRLASQLVARPDFAEGIRTRIAERNREPLWQPATVAEVNDTEVESLFTKAVDGELELDERRPGPADV